MRTATSRYEAVFTDGGVANCDWLEAIAQHPKTTSTQLLAAYAALGTETDLTDEQVHEELFWLQMLGFLVPVEISDDGQTWTFELRVPATV